MTIAQQKTVPGLWEDWYRSANQFVTSDRFTESAVVTDLIRTQFRMLDALVALHAGCAESVCPDLQALRRVMGDTP